MRRLLWPLVLLAAVNLGAAVPPRGVEILWDKFGVPHVYAPNAEGLFFGFGYAQMQSHGNLVLKLYGESRGRAAEYWGESYLENDRWVQLNEVPERSAVWYEQQHPDFRRDLDAFAAGMNAYAERHPEALDPERRRVLPITGIDPLQHVHRIVHFTYMSAAARVTSAANPTSDAAGASNAWAIAPGRTVDGKTLLLMNPHLGWGDWSTYYESNLVMPGQNLSGATQVGFPVLRFVFSDILGFTQTVNGLDGTDLYRLTLKDGGYVFDGAVRQFEQTNRTLKIRQADGSMRTEALSLRKTLHGPVVWDKNGLVLAQRTAGLDRPHLLEQYWLMATAKNFAEYQTQVARLQVPTFNITYADRDGHIMYLYNGALPKRASGDVKFWAGIVPGDTSATLWTEVHTYAELPKVIDPSTGWVQNTNDAPWSSTYPRPLQPRDFPAYFPAVDLNFSFRTVASLRMLHENAHFTFDQLLADKRVTRLEFAVRILDDLLAATDANGTERAKRAAAILRTWDRATESNSRGALLFIAWAGRFAGPAFTSRAQFAVPLDTTQPFMTPRGLKDPATAARMLDEAAGEVEQRYGSLDAAFGDFMRFKIGATDLPGNGSDGFLGAFRVMRYTPIAKDSPKQKANFGDTFVAAVEFGSPVRAQVLMSYGNSSQPGSPHAEDQLPLLSRKELRPALRTRAEVEANVESRDSFE